MSLPEKFPEGTTFIRYDGMPIAQLPDAKCVVYDPAPRPIDWEAIKSEPTPMTEEDFRSMVAGIEASAGGV